MNARLILACWCLGMSLIQAACLAFTGDSMSNIRFFLYVFTHLLFAVAAICWARSCEK